jgi:hypothetical protein
MTSDFTHDPVEFDYIASTPEQFGGSAVSLGGKSTDGAISLSGSAGSQSTLVGLSDGRPGEILGPLMGHWYTDTPANPAIGAVKTYLDITHDGRYRYRFRIAESGMWQAADGKWTRTPQGGIPASGTYKFDGHDRVTCAAANGVTIWKRVE